MRGTRSLPTAIAALAVLALPGCYTGPTYVPVASSTPASFDASWQAARGAAYDEGVHVTYEDRASGIVRGDKGPFNVLITVAPQPSGSVRVEFSVTGPSSQDQGLQNRLTQAYQKRMGR
jgi:hypothetical protein